MSDHTWKCKDGRVIKIVDMTKQHLLNSLLYIERTKREQQHRLYPVLVQEAINRKIISAAPAHKNIIFTSGNLGLYKKVEEKDNELKRKVSFDL